MKDNSTNQENNMDKMKNLAKRQIRLKNNQTKILELKKSMSETKNVVKSSNNRTDHAEERISELENKKFEIMQTQENK